MSSLTIWHVILLFAVGVVLAFPLAICICAFLGFIVSTHHRRTTPCPHCSQRQLRHANGIRTTYPTGRGTGSFYLCEACARRWFWSNDDKAFRDASGAEFDKWFPEKRDA